MPPKPNPKIKVSTQQYVNIAEIKEGTVIMRDGSFRSVLLVSSINFALKSEDEQNAIISAYVSFLNNIDFPLQIVVQSREMNIDNYITELRRRAKEQTNELLKMQTNDYVQYVLDLVAMAKIMNKRFFIVVSYDPVGDKQKKFFSRLFETMKPADIIKMKEDKFLKRRGELDRRVETVLGGLASIGLNAVPLDTQGLIELYYNSYNPGTAGNQKLHDIGELRVAE